ncbi:putative amidoligase enzyme-domain-containing protein [Xylariaceae sp. FL0255]|nr:putative amidoligase enzyme-domain-containing protein [Xylariaceae sp. FL0255]
MAQGQTLAVPTCSQLSIGVELELLLAYIEPGQVDPDGDIAGRLPPLLTLAPPQHQNPANFMQEYKGCIEGSRHSRFERVNGLVYDLYDRWAVGTDDSVGRTAEEDELSQGKPGEYKWWAVELKSPALWFSQDAVDHVSFVVNLLKSKFRLRTNVSCGFHVHVGCGPKYLDGQVIKRLGSFLWAVDPLLSRLHAPWRRVGVYSESIRFFTALAKTRSIDEAWVQEVWDHQLKRYTNVFDPLPVVDWSDTSRMEKAHGSKAAYQRYAARRVRDGPFLTLGQVSPNSQAAAAGMIQPGSEPTSNNDPELTVKSNQQGQNEKNDKLGLSAFGQGKSPTQQDGANDPMTLSALDHQINELEQEVGPKSLTRSEIKDIDVKAVQKWTSMQDHLDISTESKLRAHLVAAGFYHNTLEAIMARLAKGETDWFASREDIDEVLRRTQEERDINEILGMGHPAPTSDGTPSPASSFSSDTVSDGGFEPPGWTALMRSSKTGDNEKSSPSNPGSAAGDSAHASHVDTPWASSIGNKNVKNNSNNNGGGDGGPPSDSSSSSSNFVSNPSPARGGPRRRLRPHDPQIYTDDEVELLEESQKVTRQSLSRVPFLPYSAGTPNAPTDPGEDHPFGDEWYCPRDCTGHVWGETRAGLALLSKMDCAAKVGICMNAPNGYGRPNYNFSAYHTDELAAAAKRNVEAPRRGKRTIEFREAGGTLDTEWIGAWMGICTGILRFCRDATPLLYMTVIERAIEEEERRRTVREEDRASDEPMYDVIDLLEDIGLFAEAEIVNRHEAMFGPPRL